jgi:hypothetical protein
MADDPAAGDRTPSLPSRSVPLGADVELRVEALRDLAERHEFVLEIRLARRSPAAAFTGAFRSTADGFRVPLHLSSLVAEAIRHVGTRAAHIAAMAPMERVDPELPLPPESAGPAGARWRLRTG